MKLKALDLFCGAGGVTKGLQRAGFHVTGVDIRPQPRYCGDAFFQADALTFPLEGFHFVWASPPCQRYSHLTPQHARERHPDLILPVRNRLTGSGFPYVIENVPGARAMLVDPVRLCGTYFPGLRVLRHRYFESNVLLSVPKGCNHSGLLEGRDYVSVHDGTMSGNSRRILQEHGVDYEPGKFVWEIYQQAMGIDWMRTRAEVAEAIPPDFAEYIGRQVVAAVSL
jgi:DNA (cytosine-5)-methyltransferase 1